MPGLQTFVIGRKPSIYTESLLPVKFYVLFSLTILIKEIFDLFFLVQLSNIFLVFLIGYFLLKESLFKITVFMLVLQSLYFEVHYIYLAFVT